MRRRLLGTITIAALALAACGGDDDDGAAGGGGDVQDDVADMMIEMFDQMSELEGVEFGIDDDCIRDRLGDLSDEDARAILEAGPDGDPEVSAEAEAIGASMAECVDLGDIDLGDLDVDGG